MSEMVERVARALVKRQFRSTILTWKDMTLDQQADFLGDAHAALAAMREPTESCLRSAGEAFFDAAVAHEPGDKPNTPFVRFWRAMVDEALR